MKASQKDTSKNFVSKKLPKWMTDTKWAIRRAKRKGRIKEAEYLFIGSLELCIDYLSAMRACDPKATLPKELEDSLVNPLEFLESVLKESSSVGVNTFMKKIDLFLRYALMTGQFSEKLEAAFIELLSVQPNDRYSRAADAGMSYAKICSPNIPDKLEKLLWDKRALDYSILTGKRIPPEIEELKFKSMDSEEILMYAKAVFKGRFPQDLEEFLLGNVEACLYYAKNVVFGQLPEPLHTSIIMKSFENDEDEYESNQINQYVDFVEESKKYAINVLSNFDKNITIGEALDCLGQKTTMN